MRTIKPTIREVRWGGIIHRLIGGRWVAMPKPLQTRIDHA
jgi:hypothetical protein